GPSHLDPHRASSRTRRWSPLMNRRRNRPKRILVLTENVPLTRDARARKQIEALARRGYDVTAVCRRDPGTRVFAESIGVRLHEFRLPPEMSGKISFFWEYSVALLSAFFLCMRAALHGRFDVMQIGNPPDAQFLLTLPFKLFGSSVVVDQRDLSPEVYAD